MEFIHSLLKWVEPGINLSPNMKNLKRKVQYLSATVDDLETELAGCHPAKIPRKEAQHWRSDAQEMIESISRLEEKVDRVGQWMFASRILLGKEVKEKIQEVVELQEQYNFPRGVLIDVSPTFEQFMAAARFFRGSETIPTRNKRKYLMDDELSNVNHRRWQPCTSVNNQYLLPPPLNTCKVITTTVRPCPTSPDDGESNRSNKIGSEFIIDYSNEFVIHEIFKSRDELIRWVHDVGRRNGFVIIEKKSGAGGTHPKKSRLTLACEGSECYRDTWKNTRPKEKKSKLTGTKKCDCPFLLEAKKSDANDDWTLTVKCGVHNHPAAVCLEGHSYAGRLSHEETSLLKSMVRSSENASTMKTIYNTPQQHEFFEKAGRSEMQLLLGQLVVNKYREWHRNCKDTETIADLFFAHPVSLDLLRAFPHVILMDCTYKTTRYGLPLLEMVGVTSTEETFSVGFAYLQYEREDNYAWALGILHSLMDGNSLPNIFVTDRKLSLMNAIATIFPRATNLLCKWHINKNVLAKCKKLFENEEKWNMFITSWNMLLMSSSEEVYMKRLALLQNEFDFYAEAFQYVTSWLDAYKERFVAAWTNTYMHLGNLTTNRVGSSHAKLKRYLGSSSGSFQSNWSRIHNLLELQYIDIKSSFEKSKTIVLHKFKPAQFKDLRGNVSIAALEMIFAEAKRAAVVGIDDVACGCVVRRTHGLPCAHEIADCMRENRPIPLTSVNPHWSKLDMFNIRKKSNSFLDCKSELDMFARHYEVVDPTMQVQMLKKSREIQRPKVYPHQSFVGEFPKSLRPYIQRVEDVVTDGNCGFRAIAKLMGFGEDGWLRVRNDLLKELRTHLDHYKSLFLGQEKVDELITTLDYFKSNPGYDHWMIMPDMGHLISSSYNVVLFHMSSQQCLTFLPLRTIPMPVASRKEICIGFVNNNHFVQVFLVHGHPVPPIATNWRRYHLPTAAGWETAYSARMNDFTSLVGSSVVTTETIESDVDI
ncbi:hypothetical protein ACSBR1_019437 [Camellia fascicularis]